ncbi:uncharacterized protein AB675_6594 [Cyphellophora attinorum]|uniref:Uncharacterized protein n=1 Tax=Cyphellophora attinorum TaxID=1664694 RepID=A0A0N0NQP6_9EURO|nr:uncharacterized protein AB675_6594 [Phialophora attinorum]KPI44148.1 hypothetical protein AB675_6594 [Phialophora attinorum]
MSYDEYYDQDERYLETIHEVESIRERPQSVAHPQALPELPFRAVPPLQHDNSRVASSVYSTNDATQRDSRIASSLYSQPSPGHPPEDIKTADLSNKENVRDEISPVSTPRSATFPIGSDTTVSPIESSFPTFARAPLPEHPVKSKIPLPRSTTANEGKTPPGQRTKKQDTKWDAYSGEQTTSDTGKRGSIRLEPDQIAMQFPQLKERTKQILAGLRDPEAKKTTWGRQPPPVEDPLDAPVQQRPAWKGASGREAVVEPVRNDRSARKGPLNIPQRNVSRDNPVASQARTQSPEVSAHSSPALGSGHLPVQEPHSFHQQVTSTENERSIRKVPSQEPVKPIAPLKTRQDKVKSQTDPTSGGLLQSPFQSPPARSAAPTRAPETAATHKHGVASPDGLGDEPSTPPRRSSLRMKHKQGLHPDSAAPQDEVSRFSWTTYATTVNDSPLSMHPATDSSPVPAMPSSIPPVQPRSNVAPSASSRAMRQYSNSDARHSTASIVSRKPVGDRRRSSSMQSSTAKDLPPPPPPEATSNKDKVDILEARQAHLFTRKVNNGRIRSELTEALRRNAIIYDIYKRKEVEVRIKELEREHDEITQEQHDVGVRLHRAQKKRDNADEYEGGTALWITRVTQ